MPAYYSSKEIPGDKKTVRCSPRSLLRRLQSKKRRNNQNGNDRERKNRVQKSRGIGENIQNRWAERGLGKKKSKGARSQKKY